MTKNSSVYYLVKIDIGSKQKYIFSTNVLKDIIGASEIIRFITEELGQTVLDYMNKFNICRSKFSKEAFNGIRGNVLIEAGGNSIYIFKEKEHAIKFNKIFSKFVMKYFDGIELLMVIQEFNIEKQIKLEESPSIKYALDNIERKLTIKKGERKNLFKRISYGLTRICANTQKPAGYSDNNKERFISKESYDKQRFYKKLYDNDKNGLNEYYIDDENKFICKIKKGKYSGNIKDTEFYYTTEVDELAGDIDSKSYVGITCVDGNGMGEKINSFYKDYRYCKEKSIKENNLKWIRKYRDLTQKIKDNYEEAFNTTINVLCKNYDKYREAIFKDDKKIVPIRPIILAGDDITFISNGKIAIEATKIFAENITEKVVKFGEKNSNLTVSCGVAIVRKKYPFSRAVKLAGELEKSSKKKLKKVKEIYKNNNCKINDIDASFIDWYIDRGNILEGINEIRNKENLELTARPYMISINNVNNNFKKLDNFIGLGNNKNIFCYKFNYFYKVLDIVKGLNKNSNLKEFYRTMNKSEVNANLFSIKYLINKDFKINGLQEENMRQVIYDVIECLDLYKEVEK
ncbi:hypothetical protein DFH04_06570 [Clostridium novyi]|uniref:Cas10/Cmr2 second palm domain-containing protein n=1 Tax=Clostridium novyi TaxID=1542 RepID=UPI000EA009D2|nr:hypothetical protein [Clostridium novyi]AYF54390.1 hypothetical protein DFH04_06570 [Clostridium novyi]